jgi:hypothetical protein
METRVLPFEVQRRARQVQSLQLRVLTEQF